MSRGPRRRRPEGSTTGRACWHKPDLRHGNASPRFTGWSRHRPRHSDREAWICGLFRAFVGQSRTPPSPRLKPGACTSGNPDLDRRIPGPAVRWAVLRTCGGWRRRRRFPGAVLRSGASGLASASMTKRQRLVTMYGKRGSRTAASADDQAPGG